MSRAVPRLMAITDPVAPVGSELDDWLAALAAAGVDAVQVRRKELADRALFALVERCRDVLPSEVAVLVNGRLDVAVAARADGVHLPSAGLPTAAVRDLAARLARAGTSPLLVGRSTHSPEEVAREARSGADYVTFGPVYPTPGKEAYGPPPGLTGLRGAAEAGLPVLALGGVDAGRIGEVAAAGAWGAAAIRAFSDRSGQERLVAAARRAWGLSAW